MKIGNYLEKALDNIDIMSLMPKLEKKGFKEASVKKAFTRGSISKELAPALEDLTSISSLFWLWPNAYYKNGKKR